MSLREGDSDEAVVAQFQKAYENKQHTLATQLAQKIESRGDQREELMVAEARLLEGAARYWKMLCKLCTDEALEGIRGLLEGDSDEHVSAHFNLMCEMFFAFEMGFLQLSMLTGLVALHLLS